ncbi:MAG: hypothetical protein GY754_32855 [bacterium]|nr:hypothetical protein [bacterium]
MNFIRKIMNSDELEKVINIPDELKHQKVELLVLPFIESSPKKKTQFNPDSYVGILKLENVDEEINSIRNEWDRI